MSRLGYKISYRRHLPHIQPPGATLFVTFRLHGSLPDSVREQLLTEADRIELELKRIADPSEQAQQAYREQKRLFGLWDRALDNASAGNRWLQDSRIAQIVVDALHHQDGRRYELDTFCIMYNHVHTIFTPVEVNPNQYHPLPAIMHSLKRHTAMEANRTLGRRGQFWARESYDHIVRDPAELRRIRRYILTDPLRANLVTDRDSWPWLYSRFPAEDVLAGPK